MSNQVLELERQCDDLIMLVGKIANTVPVRQVISAAATNDSLVAYFKDLHKQRDDLLAALEFVMSAHGEQLETAFAQAQEAISKAKGGES